MSRIIRATIVLAATTVLATCGEPVRAAEVAPIKWPVAPTVTAPKNRVIEVVDKIKPTAWRVSAAVTWLDRYTASDMRLVSRCSGRAYRCITVKAGKVTGSAAVGRSSGSTITIDTGKASTKRYREWYRYDRNRTTLLVHELGHQHGLAHSTGRNVMNPTVSRWRLVLTAGQRATLRKR